MSPMHVYKSLMTVAHKTRNSKDLSMIYYHPLLPVRSLLFSFDIFFFHSPVRIIIYVFYTSKEKIPEFFFLCIFVLLHHDTWCQQRLSVQWSQSGRWEQTVLSFFYILELYIKSRVADHYTLVQPPCEVHDFLSSVIINDFQFTSVTMIHSHS